MKLHDESHMNQPSTPMQESHSLSDAEIDQFQKQGYLIFPEFLSPDHSERVSRDIDELKVQRSGGYRERNSETNGTARIIAFPELGGLTSHPPMIAKIRSLMGPKAFALHHQHAERHDEGTPASNWHHDYEQYPQTRRQQLMVHCFYYPNGLNGEVGDLLILPRSQQSIMERNAFSDKFYSEDLPGSITLDNLPSGSAVVVHSALLHARRAKPGGADNPRYFTDVSYCQEGPSDWPAYGFPMPKLWLRDQIREKALAAGHGRGGEFDRVYDTSIFYDYETATEEQRKYLDLSQANRKQNPGVRESIKPV